MKATTARTGKFCLVAAALFGDPDVDLGGPEEQKHVRKFLTFQSELTPKGVHRLRISAIALSVHQNRRLISMINAPERCVKRSNKPSRTFAGLERQTLKGCS